MKCENCSHAEMCKWIDELEGRGCDFCDEKPCELLILKSDILLYQDDKKKWAESIKQEKKNGVIILPPYFTPLLVPNDVEIRIEQESCEWGRMTFDATSGTSVFEFSDGTIKQVKQAELEQCEDAISRPTVVKFEGTNMACMGGDEIMKEFENNTRQNNDDAVSREAVIEWLKDKDIIKLSSQEETARRELNALPSVNPQKSGKWITEEIGEGRKVCCSECKESANFEYVRDGDIYSSYGHGVVKKTKYCPNCGARMERSDKE